MEIKLNNVSTTNLTDINITFDHKKINSIITAKEIYKDELFCAVNDFKIKKGNISLGKSIITIDNIQKQIKKSNQNIFYLKANYEDMLFNINIMEDIKYYIKEYSVDKLEELLKKFNLNNDILNKSYLELSSSEIKKILIIILLMIDKKFLLIENPTQHLDNNSIHVLIQQLKKIKRENRTIVLSSYNPNFLLEISDKIILIDDKGIIHEGNKYDIFSDELLLKSIKFKSPNIIKFINTTKKIKNIKLGYRDNINDLIKDVYRYAR